MKVGILGSGLMGGKLGTLFARAGHDAVFRYARDVCAQAGELAGKTIVSGSLPMGPDDSDHRFGRLA